MPEHGYIYACANIRMYAYPCMHAFSCMHIHVPACVHLCIHACADVLMCNSSGTTALGPMCIISAEFLVVTTSSNLQMSFIDAAAHDNASSESEQ